MNKLPVNEKTVLKTPLARVVPVVSSPIVFRKFP